ncbi:MAG: CbtB-domain containing protein [Gammaproteobacteria bacterium]|nr:MAG: CbtB-domain containing protein [Gammaproteobacteria bacterium]
MRSQIAAETQQLQQVLTFSRTMQLLGATLLSIIILYGAGFVNTAAVHNVAHDTRHSQGFPCH